MAKKLAETFLHIKLYVVPLRHLGVRLPWGNDTITHSPKLVYKIIKLYFTWLHSIFITVL